MASVFVEKCDGDLTMTDERLAELAELWHRKAVALREEAGRILRTVRVATDAESYCNVRAEVWDRCADKLERILAEHQSDERLKVNSPSSDQLREWAARCTPPVESLDATDELRAAAERRRAFLNGECPYRGDVEWNGYVYALAEELRDMRILAAAYLDEHPADDDELVIEEWLRSVGFVDEDHEWLTLFPDDSDCRVTYDRQNGEIKVETVIAEGFRLPHVKTRGDVRLLCRALGIELKGRNDE